MIRISALKPTREICVLLLAILVFLTQGLQIHLHTYDHVPGQSDHVHHNPVHFDFEVTPNDAHPDESAPIEFAKDGLRIHQFLIVLLGVFLAWAIVTLRGLSIFRPHANFRFRGAYDLGLKLRPPLRAPPV